MVVPEIAPPLLIVSPVTVAAVAPKPTTVEPIVTALLVNCEVPTVPVKLDAACEPYKVAAEMIPADIVPFAPR